MFQLYDRQTIVNALLFKGSTDFVEVLGFYGIFLLWFPFFAKAWSKFPLALQPIVCIFMALAGWYLSENFSGGDWIPAKAILFEHDGYYTFGQLQRGSLVLFGAFCGTLYLKNFRQKTEMFPLLFLSIGICLCGLFLYLGHENLTRAFVRVASNGGKHPPDLMFMSFSIGGAALALSFALALNNSTPLLLKPFVWIGQKPLQAFIFHIFIIFVLYRYLLDLRHKIPYETVLSFALATVLFTMLWCRLLKWKEEQ